MNAVRFLPASARRWLVSAGEDGLLHVWPLGSDALQSCRRLRGILVSDEAMTKRLGELGVANPCPPQAPHH